MEVFLAAAGGTWFAIFVLIVLIAGIASAEFDSFVGGTVTLITGLIGADLIFGYPVFASIIANPLIILAVIALYIAVGSIYTALWKWPDYIRSKSKHINSSYDNWTRSNEKNKVEKTFDNFLDSPDYKNNYAASSNKERLSAWVMMWTFSMAWELARKPAKWVFKNVYSMLGDMFEQVGKSTAKKMHDKK